MEFETFKTILFTKGHDAIEDFLGFETQYTDKDVLNDLLDQVYEQMPDDVYQAFVHKYQRQTVLSGRKDNREERFIQVGNSLLLSPVFQALTGTAKHLFLSMAMESGWHSTVVYTHGTARKYGIPGTSYDRAINELRAAGMVELLSEPSLPQYKPNCYRLVGVPFAQRK